MKIRDAGFSFWEKGALQPGAKYTRIVSKIVSLPEPEEGAAGEFDKKLANVARSTWEKAWREAEDVLGVLQDFDWRT